MGRFVDASKELVTAARHPDLLSTQEATMTGDGRFLLRSEAITGWTAADALRLSPIPEGMVIEWGVALCEALSTLHDRGHTHGCLAPRHVHLHGTESFPSVRLADTTFLHFRSATSLPTTRKVMVVEPEYLSPERAAGNRGSAFSDIWGFGALLLELLTARAPFRGRTPVESRMLAKHARPPKLPATWAKWSTVFEGTLDPSPLNRFSSALELRQELLALA
jgi:serine/threonine protein kinase